MIEGRVLLACIYSEEPVRITKSDLRRIFEPWGQLVCIEVAKSDPVNFRALVCFEELENAENVLANQKSIVCEFGKLKVYRSNKKHLYHTGMPKPSGFQPRKFSKYKLEIQVSKQRTPSLSEDTKDSESPKEPRSFSFGHGSFDNIGFTFSYKETQFPQVTTAQNLPHNIFKIFLCITGFKDSVIVPKNFCQLFSAFGKVLQLLVDCRSGFALVKFLNMNVAQTVQLIFSQIPLFGVQLQADPTHYTQIDTTSLPNAKSVAFFDRSSEWPVTINGNGMISPSCMLLVENVDSAISPEHFFRILSRIHEPRRFFILKKDDNDEEGQKIGVECRSLAGAMEIVATFNGEMLAHSQVRISFAAPFDEIFD